jgi:site-specific recombinase XerD
MKTHSPQNERIKRAYFTYLAEAKGFSEATLDAVAKALNRFETYTRFRDFKAFHIEQAKGFKASLAEQMSVRTKDRLSKATLYATLSALKRFFIWLGSPGTSPAFRTPMPNISTCRSRRRGSPRLIGRRGCRPWSKSGTSSRRCRRAPRSNAATGLSSPSPP